MPKDQKPLRRCIFCGKARGMSREHLWPDYLSDYTSTDDDTRTSVSVGFTHDDSGVAHIFPKETREQAGSALQFSMREVCEPCNNGWMSRLEERLKPRLLGLMRAERMTLDADEIALLATWATKTTMVHEFLSSPGDDPTPRPTATADMRRFLMNQQLPPPHTKVWVARHFGGLHADVRRGQFSIVEQPDPTWIGGYEVLVTTLTLEQLTVLVWATDSPRAVAAALDPAVWCQVWPGAQGLTWPTPRSASDTDVMNVIYQVGARYPKVNTVLVQRDDIAADIRRATTPSKPPVISS
ncbi:hypothetical protein [Streptacidiphilus sp. MAP5-3]|uniref:hypothetical protein n=1 Tax=unclassified Streptacidiphilus TaxID=2643834 RepID=UPI0035142093